MIAKGFGVFVAALLLAFGAHAGGQMDHGKKGPHGAQQQLGFKTQAPAAVVEEAKEVARQYEEAWAAHDAEKLASLFTEDATYMDTTGAATGSSEIKQLLEKEHQEAMKNSTARITIRSVRQLSPTTLVVDAHNTISGAATPPGAPSPMETHGTAIATKQGGTWKIQALRIFPVPQAQQMGVGGAGVEGGPAGEEMPLEPPVQPGQQTEQPEDTRDYMTE